MNFNNKIIWITGASSGIGKALAIELSKKPVKLILSSRNETALEQVKLACKHPDNIAILPLDLEDYNSLFEKTAKDQREPIRLRLVEMFLVAGNDNPDVIAARKSLSLMLF